MTFDATFSKDDWNNFFVRQKPISFATHKKLDPILLERVVLASCLT